MGNRYFGNLRIGEGSNSTVTLPDGTIKALPIVSNPIDSGIADVRFEGTKLTKKLANELYERDKDSPFRTDTLG